MEFELIDLIRARTSQARADVDLGIGDDAALLDVPAGLQLVACTDTMVAGVHFPVGTAPEDVGWKSLAVNLSDLAAMGATPAWALLALTLPRADAGFVESFAEGFAALARRHDVALVGGDTTQGPLTVTVTALGTVPVGAALRRDGAKAGDALFVTGTLGDAAGALKIGDRRPGTGDRMKDHTALLARLNRPEPRIAAGLALRGIASACVDVSDGMLADLGHVCDASHVAAEVNADALPISPALAAMFDRTASRSFALSGGDDYELCFSVPAAHEAEVAGALDRSGCGATRIGRIVAGSGVRVVDAGGHAVSAPHAGWEHFSQ
ncbi:MAG: thiamine-phosphate kinase [Rhodanobacteraceae bacterium]